MNPQRVLTGARTGSCVALAILVGGTLSATAGPALARAGSRPATFDGLVVSGCALLALVLYGWLLLGAICTVAGALGGRAGSAARLAARAVAPVSWRRTVRAACGIAVAAIPLSATPGVLASADHGNGRQVERVGPRLDGLPMPDRPTGRPVVVVRAGDSLWSVAAEALPTGASVHRIDRSWPAWYAANRERVGGDPDLIFPGTVLRPPPDRSRGMR